MDRNVVALVAFGLATSLLAHPVETTITTDADMATIAIMPTTSSIHPPDDLSLASMRDPLRTRARVLLPRIVTAMRADDELAAAATTRGRLTSDPVYRLLLDRYDQTISRYRGERGAVVKRAHADHLARTRAALRVHGIAVAAADPLSGMLFVDGALHDVAAVRTAVPWAQVDVCAPPVSFDPIMNAETRVSWLHGRGLSGASLDYFLLDEGLDSTVTDIVSGHTLYANTDASLAPPFGTTSFWEHGTRVCSVLTSVSNPAFGGAPGLDDLFISGVRYWFPPMYARLWYCYVKSLSWGLADTDSLFGDTPEALSVQFGDVLCPGYDGFARLADSAIDEFHLFVANSAGNFTSNPYRIANTAHAYNVVSVNALDAQGDSTRTNACLCSAAQLGGWGPAADGRKKPDLSVPVAGMQVQGNGGIVSTIQDCATSYAAPQVAAASLLLMEGTGLTDPRTIKALLINTAYKPDAADSVGWEPGFGWGMLDADHSEFHGENGDCFEDTLTVQGGKGSKKFYLGAFLPCESSSRHQDRATLVWNRHLNWSYADTSIAAKNLANLDLYLYDRLTGAQVAASRSTIDNVEQVAWTDEVDTLQALLAVDVQSDLPLGYDYECFSLEAIS